MIADQFITGAVECGALTVPKVPIKDIRATMIKRGFLALEDGKIRFRSPRTNESGSNPDALFDVPIAGPPLDL